MDQEIKDLLNQNLAVSQEILKVTKYLKRRAQMETVWTIVKILLIVVPLIIGIIYLPPILKGALSSYGSIMTGGDLTN